MTKLISKTVLILILFIKRQRRFIQQGSSGLQNKKIRRWITK